MPDAHFAQPPNNELQGIRRNPKEREVMSPATVGISTTYKTRVALKVIVRKGEELILDSYRTVEAFASVV
jgi:phosphotransferase system IIA component